MSPWEVIEQALASKNPPRRPKWLADALGVPIQVVSNWKKRGVPPKWFRPIADELGISVDQVEGRAPLPWEKPTEWPFEDRALFERVRALTPSQRLEIQGAIRNMAATFERAASESAPARDTDLSSRDEELAKAKIRKVSPLLPSSSSVRKASK